MEINEKNRDVLKGAGDAHIFLKTDGRQFVKWDGVMSFYNLKDEKEVPKAEKFINLAGDRDDHCSFSWTRKGRWRLQ